MARTSYEKGEASQLPDHTFFQILCVQVSAAVNNGRDAHLYFEKFRAFLREHDDFMETRAAKAFRKAEQARDRADVLNCRIAELRSRKLDQAQIEAFEDQLAQEEELFLQYIAEVAA